MAIQAMTKTRQERGGGLWEAAVFKCAAKSLGQMVHLVQALSWTRKSLKYVVQLLFGAHTQVSGGN